MNINQPMGPRNRTITSQPMRGLNGQRDPAGMRHGPACWLRATCASGSTKPISNTVHANDADKIQSPLTPQSAENWFFPTAINQIKLMTGV